MVSIDKLLISYNFGRIGGRHGNWIKCDVRFGRKYLPLINHIIKKAEPRDREPYREMAPSRAGNNHQNMLDGS